MHLYKNNRKNCQNKGRTKLKLYNKNIPKYSIILNIHDKQEIREEKRLLLLYNKNILKRKLFKYTR